MKRSYFVMIAFAFLSVQTNAHVSNNNLIEARTLDLSAVNLTGGFFDQFLFQAQGDCKKISSVSFQSTNSWEQALLGKDSQGRQEIAGISIQLFPDGTYYADYSELAIKETTSSAIFYDTLFSKVVEGNWSLNGNQLVVNGIGFGTPNTIVLSSGAVVDSIQFQMTSVLNDNRVLNATMNIGKSGTNIGPRGISINKYCGVN